MSESEWLTSKHLLNLLTFVTSQGGFTRSKAGRRKLRLFSCACCRRHWRQLMDERSRRAVEMAETLADGQAAAAAAEEARAAAFEALRAVPMNDDADDGVTLRRGAEAAYSVLDSTIGGCVWGSAGVGGYPPGHPGHDRMLAQIHLLRDTCGNPFQSVKLPRALLAWRDTTILRLAQAAYDERELPSGHLDGKRLAILADALEEAGCTNEDMLAHLRGSGPHVRGCWVVDLALGKS